MVYSYTQILVSLLSMKLTNKDLILSICMPFIFAMLLAGVVVPVIVGVFNYYQKPTENQEFVCSYFGTHITDLLDIDCL